MLPLIVPPVMVNWLPSIYAPPKTFLPKTLVFLFCLREGRLRSNAINH
jgi:hypothetical protein